MDLKPTLAACLLTGLAALVLLSACSRDKEPTVQVEKPDASLLRMMEESAQVPLERQGVEYTLTTPLPHGVVDFYVLVGTDLRKLDRVPFHANPVVSFVDYQNPSTIDQSLLLAHVTTLGDAHPGADEYVCMTRIPHTGNRHSVTLSCDLASTVTYYMSATVISPPGSAPFGDIAGRADRWEALNASRGNDLIAFFISVFGTVHNALIKMAPDRFNPQLQSVRTLMEAISAQALETYQRDGQLSAAQLLQIADDVTGGSLPLVRLTRFPQVYADYAHVEPVTLTDSRGNLTRPDRAVDMHTLQAELERFFLRNAPLEFADPRTHVPQSMRHQRLRDALLVMWDPLPHMDGYNVYLNGEYFLSTRDPRVLLPADATGTVMVRAVGYAGEYDGQRHPLSDEPTTGASS